VLSMIDIDYHRRPGWYARPSSQPPHLQTVCSALPGSSLDSVRRCTPPSRRVPDATEDNLYCVLEGNASTVVDTPIEVVAPTCSGRTGGRRRLTGWGWSIRQGKGRARPLARPRRAVAFPCPTCWSDCRSSNGHPVPLGDPPVHAAGAASAGRSGGVLKECADHHPPFKCTSPIRKPASMRSPRTTPTTIIQGSFGIIDLSPLYPEFPLWLFDSSSVCTRTPSIGGFHPSFLQRVGAGLGAKALVGCEGD